MSSAPEYRELAAEQRRYAQTADLPMVRMMHEKAAVRWDDIAAEIERTALRGVAPDGRTRRWAAARAVPDLQDAA